MIRIEDKNRAFHMKHEGFSVSDITKTLNISRNTLYLWFNQIVSGETIETTLQNKKGRSERLKRLNEAREEKLNKYYQMAKEEAEIDFTYIPL